MGKPFHEFWRRTKVKGTVRGDGVFRYVDPHDEWELDHAYAGEHSIQGGGACLRIGEKIDGSAQGDFGVSRWPYVDVDVPLPAGRPELVTELVRVLQETVAKFMNNHELLRGPRDDE